MGQLFTNSIPQPQNIFFDLSLGGLNAIYKSPEIPIDFSYESTIDGHSFEMTLFDVTGFQVEPAIYNARNPLTGIAGGTFRFGYQGNSPVYSRTYNFKIDNYFPTFLHNSFGIKIIGSFALSAMTSTNQYSGTIQNILQNICNNHNWQLNINPPLGVSYMQDCGYVDKDSTAAMEMRFIKWVNESDWSFVQRVVQWARDQEGKGGYLIFLSTNSSGEDVLNIVRPNLTSPTYTYTIQAANSSVIAWEPNIDFSAAIMGANGWQQNGIQRSTGDEQKVVYDQGVMQPYQQQIPGQSSSPLISSTPPPPAPPAQLTYFNSEKMPSAVTGSSVRNRPASSSSPYCGINPGLNHALKMWLQTSEATLTVLGDPNIDPFDPACTQLQTCQVNCFYPVNYNTGNTPQQPHYTSGLYYIKGVKHVIKLGSYQTLLYLMRMDNELPDSTVQQLPAQANTTPITTVNIR